MKLRRAVVSGGVAIALFGLRMALLGVAVALQRLGPSTPPSPRPTAN